MYTSLVKSPTPAERLQRMRKSFEQDYSILSEDYEFFTTGDTKSPEPSPLSKVVRKSEEPSEKRSPRLS